MSRSNFRIIAVIAAAATLSAPAWAGGRPADPSRNWFGHIGAGWTFANGATADVVDDDWIIFLSVVVIRKFA